MKMKKNPTVVKAKILVDGFCEKAHLLRNYKNSYDFESKLREYGVKLNYADLDHSFAKHFERGSVGGYVVYEHGVLEIVLNGNLSHNNRFFSMVSLFLKFLVYETTSSEERFYEVELVTNEMNLSKILAAEVMFPLSERSKAIDSLEELYKEVPKKVRSYLVQNALKESYELPTFLFDWIVEQKRIRRVGFNDD